MYLANRRGDGMNRFTSSLRRVSFRSQGNMRCFSTVQMNREDILQEFYPTYLSRSDVFNLIIQKKHIFGSIPRDKVFLWTPLFFCCLDKKVVAQNFLFFVLFYFSGLKSLLLLTEIITAVSVLESSKVLFGMRKKNGRIRVMKPSKVRMKQGK